MAAKPTSGVLTHGEVIDVQAAMDKLCSLDCDRCTECQQLSVKLDSGRTVTIRRNENESYEVVLAD